MTTLPLPYITPEQYLAIERRAEKKSEYYGCEMFAMSGASEPHNILTVNVSSELRTQLRGRPCRSYASDMRIKVSAAGLYTYPDVIAVCGERTFDDAQHDTLTNPTVIVEVLSPSTELYDRGKKFEMNSRLENLSDYILISQDKPRVEHFARQGDRNWLLSVADDLGAVLTIASLDCAIALSDIYENLDFALDDCAVV
jgi:Uma2 family endonuclease